MIFEVFLQKHLVVSTKCLLLPRIINKLKDYCLSKQTLLITNKLEKVYEYVRKYDRRRVGIILHQWQ